MSKSEEVLHLKLVEIAFKDMFLKNYTNDMIAEKYNCSVHTSSKARSSKEYEDKCKKYLKKLNGEIDKKFEKIKANSVTYLEEFLIHILDEKDYSPLVVNNLIKILERIDKRFSQKHEIEGNISGEIKYEIPPEMQKVIDENNKKNGC